MMTFSKLIYIISSLIFSICLSASTAVWAAGTGSGITITSASDNLSVVAFNFNDAYTTEEVNEWHGLAVLAYNLLGVEGSVTLYPPAQIETLGYDGDSLHNWLVDILSTFQSYTQVKVNKSTNSELETHIFNAWTWSPGDESGFYIGNIELPENLPLGELFGLLGEGSRYINIVTSEAYNNGIENVLRIELYYQETPSAERTFLAAIEISEATLKSIFSSPAIQSIISSLLGDF